MRRFAWSLLAAALALLSLLSFVLLLPQLLALQGGAGFKAWQLLSAGLAHWNGLHLGGNLLGLLVLALLGQRAGLQGPEAWAWAASGPLGHAFLLGLQPALPPYVGLSGWLHGGVAVAALSLMLRAQGQRWLGLAIAAGLLAKLLLEQPWGPLLRPGDWWGGATLPLGHACGALAGALSFAACYGLARRRLGLPGSS